MFQTPLTRSQFESAFYKGQGRALMHVQQWGLAGVDDLVLSACFRDPAYDQQCESSRAEWLLAMFADSPEYPRFSTAIVKRLWKVCEEWENACSTDTDEGPADAEDELDLAHLCDLAAAMALKGNIPAGEALRACVYGQSTGWPVGLSPLVALDGIPAITKIAQRCGSLLKDDPQLEDLPPLTLFEDFEKVEAELWRLADNDPEIKCYLEWERVYYANRRNAPSPEIEEERRAENRARARRELPLSKILTDATAKAGEYSYPYRRFGIYATPEELETVWQRLIAEPDEQVCLRLLWVFQKTHLPHHHPRLWNLAEAEDVRVSRAALTALAQISDPEIGEQGRSRLQTCLKRGAFAEQEIGLLALFILNYKPGDELLVKSALEYLPSDEVLIHDFGMDILHICEQNSSPALANLLYWIYEHNPCSLCRRRAVEEMLNIDSLPSEILTECRFDADEDTRWLVDSIETVTVTPVKLPAQG